MDSKALAVLAILVLPTQAAAETTPERLVLGVVPQMSATRLAKAWVPFLDKVSKAAGIEIRFATTKDIPTFEKCLSQGTYGLAYMNPYHYVEFHDAPGYIAFAHQRGQKLKGIVVAAKTGGVANLADLDGKTLAFPSPAALGASVLPRAELALRQIQFTPQYVKSHDSVYRAVAAGLYPAGGGVMRTFDAMPGDVRSQLRIIYETKGYTPHAFAAHPRVPAELVARIADAMAALPPDAPVLQAIGMQGIDRAGDAEWNDIRELSLTRDQTDIVGGDTACPSD